MSTSDIFNFVAGANTTPQATPPAPNYSQFSINSGDEFAPGGSADAGSTVALNRASWGTPAAPTHAASQAGAQPSTPNQAPGSSTVNTIGQDAGQAAQISSLAAQGASKLGANTAASYLGKINQGAGDVLSGLQIYNAAENGFTNPAQDIGALSGASHLAGQAAQAGMFGADSSAVGSAAGDAASALGPLSAAYSLYNFANDWQSGKTGADAINGAETGASVGSVIPVVGTALGAVIGAAVGAISSAFGGGAADPETMMLDNYAPAFDKNPQIASTLTPAQNYQLLSGVFDAKNNSPGHSTPLEQYYGRMGESAFMNDVFNQVNNAFASGKIGANSSPQQIYQTVVQPYLASKTVNGQSLQIQPNWTTAHGAKFGNAMGAAVTNLITAWMVGGLNNDSPIGISGQTDSGLPAFKGTLSPQLQQISAQMKQQAAAQAQQQQQARQRAAIFGNHGAKQRLADGGEVTPQHLAKGGQVRRRRQFMGQMCTKDCSGHAAGYNWGAAHPEEECDGNSESFNEGCELASEHADSGFCKGGEVKATINTGAATGNSKMIDTYKKFLKLKGAKGYADGGVVEDTEGNIPVAQGGASQGTSVPVPAQEAQEAQAQAGQPGVLHQTVAAVTTALGQNTAPAQVEQTTQTLRATNPGVSDQQIAQQLVQNMPSLIASVKNAQNFQNNAQSLSNITPEQVQQAAQQEQRAQAWIPTLVAGMATEPTAAGAAAKAYVQEPVAAIEAEQGIQGTQLKNAAQNLTNVSQEVTNEQEAQKAASGAMGLQFQQQAYDPSSAYSKAYVGALQRQLLAANHPGAAQVAANLTGMSAIQAEGAAKAVLGVGQQAEGIRSTAASAAASAASAALSRAQTPGESAESAREQYINQRMGVPGYTAANTEANGAQANNTQTDTGGQATQAPSATGQYVSPFTGVPLQKTIPADYAGKLYSQPQMAQQQQNEAAFTSISTPQAASARQQAEYQLTELIKEVGNYKGPTGPYTGPVMEAIDPQRQLMKKIGSQYVAALGGSGTNQQQGYLDAGFPSLNHIRDPKMVQMQLAIALANLQRADMMSREGQYVTGKGYDIGQVNPTQLQQSMQSYMWTDPQGRVVQVKTYGNSQAEQYQLGLDAATGKKNGWVLRKIANPTGE